MIETLRQRRSIRKFTGHPLTPEEISTLTEALLRSPTSRNITPWEFLLVEDPGMLKKLSASKQHGTAFLAGAALAVVIVGDERKSDVWIEDCSIAAFSVQLTAQKLGLGSCWGQIRNRPHDDVQSAEAYVQNLLGIPAHYRVGMIIGIGYPAEMKKPVPAERLPGEKIHYEHFRPFIHF